MANTWNLLEWRGKTYWICACALSLWALIIMEAVKIHHETRYIDQPYFWCLLTVNLLAFFLLWMSGTPYIFPGEEEVEVKAPGARKGLWRHAWERHPGFHYATGGFGKFFFLLVVLDIYYYSYIMRDEWYEIIRILVMHSTLVVGIFILNSHNISTTSRSLITLLGFTLFVYNVVMIVKSFYLLTGSVHHLPDSLKPLIPLKDVAKAHGDVNLFELDVYRGFEHTRVYDMVLFTSFLMFFAILLKLREKLLYADHDVLGWNTRIERTEGHSERERLIGGERVVEGTNTLEA